MAWGFTVAAVDEPLRARALRLLARREHSRAELRRKLAPHAQEGLDLEALLDDFTKRGWLSEERFVEQAVRAKSRRFGPLKIAHHLREKGIEPEAIAQALLRSRAGEGEALEAAWRSRFGCLPRDAREKSRQVRFLQGRGFALESILKLLRDGAGRKP
ncbi:MAG: recombination regulator RecX [Betaproteobacteria bacterium]|jgi:regulatory protein|nr:recombination regulator RecX [Betaproteobacteria bacterium]